MQLIIRRWMRSRTPRKVFHLHLIYIFQCSGHLRHLFGHRFWAMLVEWDSRGLISLSTIDFISLVFFCYHIGLPSFIRPGIEQTSEHSAPIFTRFRRVKETWFLWCPCRYGAPQSAMRQTAHTLLIDSQNRYVTYYMCVCVETLRGNNIRRWNGTVNEKVLVSYWCTIFSDPET